MAERTDAEEAALKARHGELERAVRELAEHDPILYGCIKAAEFNGQPWEDAMMEAVVALVPVVHSQNDMLVKMMMNGGPGGVPAESSGIIVPGH